MTSNLHNMHKNNEHLWEQWSDRTIDGTEYTFGHLRSFDMQVKKEARGSLPELTINIRVVFDCHVVTEEVTEYIQSDPRYWLDLGKNSRRFEIERYQYSLKLPDLISGLPTGKVKCYMGKKNNYMIWESGNTETGKEHYQAYFDIYKPTNQPADAPPYLVLYVQSAFLKNEPFAAQRDRFKAFGQICAELAGAIPTKPKGEKSKIKRK